MNRYLSFVFSFFICLESLHASLHEELPLDSHYSSPVCSLGFNDPQDSSEFITAPFLFELERDSIKSLLLGSAHAVKIDRFPPYAKEPLLSSKSLVVETAESFKTTSKEKMLEYGMLCIPSPDCWISCLEPHLKDHLEEKLMPNIRKYHQNIDLMELTPLLAFLKYNSPDNNEGMDEQLVTMHGSSQVFSLENACDVFKLMEQTFDLSTFKKQLEADYAEKQEDTKETTDYGLRWLDYHYCNGVLHELKDFLLSSPYNSSMITRNHAWLPKIENFHMNNLPTNLSVVGLAHLFGEDGLLNLLYTKKGFLIRQITPDGSFKPININDFI